MNYCDFDCWMYIVRGQKLLQRTSPPKLLAGFCTGLNMCFGSSWELSHRDGSFEHLLMCIGFGMWLESSWEWPH